MGIFKGALLALGMVVGSPAFAGSGVVSDSNTGVVLECSSGKVSMQDRVNVIVTRDASGKITAEVESLSGKRGQAAVVARRGVSEKHGPAGTSYKSETGDLVLTRSASGAKVLFKQRNGDVKAKVSCRSGSGLFETKGNGI
jgi:hypothetical protein